MADDFSSAFIQGGAQIQNFLGKREQQQLDIQKLLEEQAFQQGQQKNAQEFQGGQGDLNRANAVKTAGISAGPGYMAQNRANREEARGLQAGQEAASALASDPFSLTSQGKVQNAYLSRGLLSGPQAVATLPDRSKAEWMGELGNAAMSEQDPTKAAELRGAMDQAMKTYDIISEHEAWRDGIKKIASEGEQVMPYKYDPAPVIPAVKSVLSNMFPDYDPQKQSLLSYMKDNGGWDGSFNGKTRQTIREEMNKDLAQNIMETNPDFSNNYLRAYQAASEIWKQVEIGGIKNLLEPTNVDENGNPIKGAYKGYRPIDMKLEKASFFSRGQTSTASPTPVQQAPASGVTAEQMREFYRTGKTPVAESLK